MSGDFYTCVCCKKSAYKNDTDYFANMNLCNTCGYLLASAPCANPDLYERIFKNPFENTRTINGCVHCMKQATFKNNKHQMIIRNFCEDCYKKYLIPNMKVIKTWKKLKNL